MGFPKMLLEQFSGRKKRAQGTVRSAVPPTVMLKRISPASFFSCRDLSLDVLVKNAF
jgi:hypothetical protein